MKFSNIIRKTAFAAALLIGISFAVSAQSDSTKHSPEKRAKAMTDKMKTDLTLSDDQYKQVYDINLKYAQKNQEAAGGEGSRMQKAKALKSGNASKNEELKAVLNSQQFEKYTEAQKEKKANAREALKKRRDNGGK
ncbi:MAG: hypothetical protein ABW007_14330 [Chitinophagaceae bacterium]